MEIIFVMPDRTPVPKNYKTENPNDPANKFSGYYKNYKEAREDKYVFLFIEFLPFYLSTRNRYSMSSRFKK